MKGKERCDWGSEEDLVRVRWMGKEWHCTRVIKGQRAENLFEKMKVDRYIFAWLIKLQIFFCNDYFLRSFA